MDGTAVNAAKQGERGPVVGFKNWETPPDFFRKLDEEFHFTLDAAASHENALCDRYATVDGCFVKFPGCEPQMWHNGNGLEKEWDSYRVFCNPPYDSSIGQWVDKALRREAEVAVLLLPPSVDTKWFQSIWDLRPTVWVPSHSEHIIQKDRLQICFMPGRLSFYHPALKTGWQLKDHDLHGDAIFDYSKPHVVGPAPRAGNLLVVVRR